MSWKPNVTVATIVEKDNRFLFVEELDDEYPVFNQPAGHVEEGESIVSAALRETVEETGWEVKLTHFIGTYVFTSPTNNITYLRFCFAATPVKHQKNAELDDDIIAAHWLSAEEIRSKIQQTRSPLVLKCLEDYLSGNRYPLTTLYEHDYIANAE